MACRGCETSLPKVLFSSQEFDDERGLFFKSCRVRLFREAAGFRAEVAQDSHPRPDRHGGDTVSGPRALQGQGGGADGVILRAISPVKGTRKLRLKAQTSSVFARTL